MGLFGSKPSPAEVRGFARGKRSSGNAAEAYAKQQRDAAATKRAVAARRRAEQRRSK
jgi:hypothetical protein